jgi:hypothetical protein
MFLLCALPTRSNAATIDGVTFPPSVTVEGRTLHLNGVGLRTLTLFRIHAYVAALYLEQPSRDADAIGASTENKMLILQFLRAASKEQVQSIFRRSAKRSCGADGCPAADAQDFERLIALFPAVKRGDYTTYVFTRSGMQVLMNNAPLATFDNPDLARRVLGAFIGPQAASPSLRNALLGRPAG